MHKKPNRLSLMAWLPRDCKDLKLLRIYVNNHKYAENTSNRMQIWFEKEPARGSLRAIWKFKPPPDKAMSESLSNEAKEIVDQVLAVYKLRLRDKMLWRRLVFLANTSYAVNRRWLLEEFKKKLRKKRKTVADGTNYAETLRPRRKIVRE